MTGKPREGLKSLIQNRKNHTEKITEANTSGFLLDKSKKDKVSCGWNRALGEREDH